MKKKRNKGLWILPVLLVALYLADYYYFSRKPILYPNFGITIPSGYTTHGIDVSHYQRNIDWSLVKDMTDKGHRISFAIVKATEGSNLIDSKFTRNWKELKSIDLLRGAYLYFHPNRSGKQQAEYFMKKVELEEGDLPPVVDIEETNGRSKTQIKKELKQCLNALEDKHRCKPIIYTSVDFYDAYLGEEFDEYPLWAAHYERLYKPRIERSWIIWQHNTKGHVNGIDAEVDFNVVNGSLSALKRLCL